VILVVSTAADDHTSVVLRELAALGAEAYLCDLSRFPGSMRLALEYRSPQHIHFDFIEPDGRVIPLHDVGAVWWRRPQSYILDSTITRPSHRTFALSETHEAFAGLWQALDVFWMNHPTRDEVAARKAFQLRIASEVGLEIPATLITNDPEEARSFIKSQDLGQVVYKAFSATAQEWRETRVVRDQELALLDHVRHAPVIFQEYVPATVDVRVTIVGSHVFPAAIHSQETSYPVDFRMDMGCARVEAMTLPREVLDGLRGLMERLDLVYGAVDMRRTPEGRFIFLEVNPSGQWLFIEHLTGQPITATLARLLADHARARSRS
jgi:glutathione synthase/RimK-type ligase-like ATP-grasp enzyme